MKNELLVNPLNRAGQARYPIAICQIRVVIVVVKVVMLIVLLMEVMVGVMEVTLVGGCG